jgi:hypothetical protein
MATADSRTDERELTDEQGQQVLVIMPQESSASVSVFAKQGRYQVEMVADPDGKLIEPLHLMNLPTHFFLNRKGVVTHVSTGVLTTQEVQPALRGY